MAICGPPARVLGRHWPLPALDASSRADDHAGVTRWIRPSTEVAVGDRYGGRVHEPGVGDPDSDLGAGRGPAAEQLVRITTGRVVHAEGEALVVTVAGEIDVLTVARLREAVAAGFDELPDGAALVIDLTDVTFLGSAGLQALVDATRAARRWREPVRIVVDHTRPVVRPIELAGLDDVLALFHTVDQAIRSSS
ncbi:MAG: STAS domain-containing protein [Pseudonocardiaceae bacterium]